ncbi:MAG TPA: GAF domain-containing protein, partial [Candidatus Polarisedimenticolia bacterium]|nr:GAF domain-containing protein [Candidatus Polarisedimenticolia bacterium]
DAIAAALAGWLAGQPRPEVMAPFTAGAGIPHAPDALIAVPLLSEGVVLGAMGLGRRGEGKTFTAGDLKILSVIGSSAASVLLQRKNLDLARLSRRLEERNRLLKGILAISREIASSLDLERLLHALANLPTRTLGFDRCAVLLDEGSRLRLRAVSGVAKPDRADEEMRSLEKLLVWVASRRTRVLVQQAPPAAGVMVKAEPPEAAQEAASHMERAGAPSFLAIPLEDDQGLLGVVSFESGTVGFIDETRLEGAAILANQATVALRNARLYGEVPFIGLLGPLRQGMSRARALPRRRLAVWGAVAVALLGVLVFGRWDLRVPGRATVLPSRVVLVSARVRGVVREVSPYKEGDRVPKGAVLARLEVPDLEIRHAEARAQQEKAERNLVKLEAEGRAAELQLARVEAARWRDERAHVAGRLEESALRAPIAGVLLTPRLAERAGELLDVGGVFATLAEMEPLKVEIAVRETDADVLVSGAPGGAGGTAPMGAVLKFHAFPQVDFAARIDRVRASLQAVDGASSLVAEGVVDTSGPDGARLRPGMNADARISAGPRPILWLLVRRPYKLIRSLIWL